MPIWVAVAVLGSVLAVVLGALALRFPGRDRPPPIERTLPFAGSPTSPPGVVEVAGLGATAVDAPIGALPTGSQGVSTANASTAAASTTVVLIVHAAGAVVHPGVYELPAGARVAELIRSAGGVAAAADIDALNLAAPLTDGMRLYVPRRGQSVPSVVDGAIQSGPPANAVGPAAPASASASAAAAGQVINLNTATAEQLDSLPGVGPATAEAILDYRTQHGRFRSVAELLEVRGIGEAKLAGLRRRLRV